MRVRSALVCASVGLFGGLLAAQAAQAAQAVTPGWECVPSTAGKPVLSGGIGAAPKCHRETTPVLAPTFVRSGAGGKATVRFSAVNVQILNGLGHTASANGKGNLVLGYDESPGAQSGSHDLILGQHQTFSGFGDVVAGLQSTVAGNYAAAFGQHDRAIGPFSLVAGAQNVATGLAGTAVGGHSNLAAGEFSSVLGGCKNEAGTASLPTGSCTLAGQAVLGGFENKASGLEATISGGEVGQSEGDASSIAGGQFNVASGGGATVAGGDGNSASGSFASILGGFENTATTFQATVSGGESNQATGTSSSILGGDGNITSTDCQAIPASPGTC